MTPKHFLSKIKLLKLDAPITKKFEFELNQIGMWNYEVELKKKHKNNQKDHWLGWISEQDGPGFYNRKNWEGTTAKSIYNRIVCPPMLLWLGEAAGIPGKKILSAKREALSANKSFPSQCAAIRRIIPWEIVEEFLINKK